MGLRDRINSRPRLQVMFPLRIEDDTAARDELIKAQESGDIGRITDAHAAVKQCYEELVITAVPPVELEALIEAHPPLPADQDKKLFNPTTFVPALLAACVAGDITEDDWAQYTTKGCLTTGEVAALFNAAWDVNYRSPSPSLPKESTLTRS